MVNEVVLLDVESTMKSATHRNYASGKLAKFTQLKPGWHFGKGLPFKKEVISLAKEIVERLKSRGYYTIDAFPGLSGDIKLTAYPYRWLIEITILSPSNIEFLVSDKDEKELMYRDGLSVPDIDVLIENIRNVSWTLLSAPYLQSIGIARETLLTAWLFGTARKQKVEELVSSMQTVQPDYLNNIQSVNTCLHT